MKLPLPRFEVRRGRVGVLRKRSWYFVLLAKNGEIIATSEHYTTLNSARTGIASVRLCAEKADVVDRL